MGKVIVKKEGFKCERCKHEWIPNDIKKEPTVCPKCKSPYWDKPLKNKIKKKNKKEVQKMGKKCPKCGKVVSCKQWMYLTKMCRRCDWQHRGKFLVEKRKLKKKKAK